MDHKETAVQYFQSGFNCAQSVFAAYADELGLQKDHALKISTGFGGGMARLQKTCGAVTGSFMVLGLKYGKDSDGDDSARDKTYKLVRIFADRFTAQHGTLECSKLMGCDLNTPEGQLYSREYNLHANVCTQCIKTAAGLLDELLKSSE
jgi:C_GCAxxG_C_C family probable redox protein